MRWQGTSWVWVGLLAVTAAGSPPPAPVGQRWEAVPELTDEFQGATLDATRWLNRHPRWQGRRPSRYVPENTFVADGCLNLRSTLLRDPATVADPNEDVWVGAAVCAGRRRAEPGWYYEARIRSSDVSLTSSFWFGMGTFSEIDVVEQMGHPSNPLARTLGKDLAYQYHSNAFHWDRGRIRGFDEAEWFMPTRGGDTFHVYGFWWQDPNTLLLYHDGRQVMTLRAPVPFDEPLVMLFDTETFPQYYAPWGRPGLPAVASLRDPQRNTMRVDWIRTYRLVPDARRLVCAGGVTCAETGRPLKDTWIHLLDTDRTVLSDAQGRFSLAAADRTAGRLVFDHAGYVVAETAVQGVTHDLRVALRPRRMSAASWRWLTDIENEQAYRRREFRQDRQWRFRFRQTDLTGDFASDPNLIRRDPSAIISVGDRYYVYYTRGHRTGRHGQDKFFPWDRCDLWYATSSDGWTWHEQGPAVTRGPAGRYDDRSVFTPEVLAHEGRYYLVYQCVGGDYVYRVKNTVGMAVADSPAGPWRTLPEPILRPTNNGVWHPTEEHAALRKGDFDSHKVHDPCLLFYHGRFYLYYKGERMGEQRFFGQREIRWGVAIADRPEGPYVKSPYNPVTTSGHEVCIWPYAGGVALLHTADGPEAHTVQWAPDGINFEVMQTVKGVPIALGLFRGAEPGTRPQDGIRWGLCHTNGGGPWRTSWNYLRRFDEVTEE